MGSKKKPFYRIVVADSRSPRDGRFIETVGTYNPLLDPAEVTIKEDLVLDWLSKGGEDTVENTVALCPNCHKKMHILNSEKDVEVLSNIVKKI